MGSKCLAEFYPEERSDEGSPVRGFTVALTLVAAAALSVSFYSAAKARSSRREIGTLKTQTHQLTQTNQSLEANLRETRERLAREETTANELKEALAQEQSKSKALAEKTAAAAEAKQSKSNLKTR